MTGRLRRCDLIAMRIINYAGLAAGGTACMALLVACRSTPRTEVTTANLPPGAESGVIRGSMYPLDWLGDVKAKLGGQPADSH